MTTPRAVLAIGVLALVALIVLVQRPAGDPEPDDTSTSAPEETTSAPAAPAVASDEDFCAGFRALAQSQAEFAAGSADEATLEESADALVDTGVPAGMSLPARSGYYALISGVYDSIGLELAPEAVGAPGEPVEGGDGAFSSYMGRFCPP